MKSLHKGFISSCVESIKSINGDESAVAPSISISKEPIMNVKCIRRQAALGTIIALALVVVSRPPPLCAELSELPVQAAPAKTQSPDDLVAQADALADAGDYSHAANQYIAAAHGYKAANKPDEEAGAYKKSADMGEKLADVAAEAGRY